jgi:hypothetical protein
LILYRGFFELIRQHACKGTILNSCGWKLVTASGKNFFGPLASGVCTKSSTCGEAAVQQYKDICISVIE